MAEAAKRPKGWKLLKAALATRKAATMLAFGFSSGLPFALLIGTLNAWLGDAKINLATIGVLSWIGLGYAFKFLWSPLVDRVKLPVLGNLGRRKSWIVLCQAGLIIAFIALGLTDPATNIGGFAIFAVIGALLRPPRTLRWMRGASMSPTRRLRWSSLGGLSIRLSHRLDRRRRLRAVARRAHAVGHGSIC